MTRRIQFDLAVIAVSLSVLAFLVISAGPSDPPGRDPCSHGNTGKECREDPQPDKGKDCEKHGKQGGNNEDHCKTVSATNTPRPTRTPRDPSPTRTPRDREPTSTATPTPTDTPVVVSPATVPQQPVFVPQQPVVVPQAPAQVPASVPAQTFRIPQAGDGGLADGR